MQIFLFLFILIIFIIFYYILLYFYYSFDEEFIIAFSLLFFLLLLIFAGLDLVNINYFTYIWNLYLMFRLAILYNLSIINYFSNINQIITSFYYLFSFMIYIILLIEWNLFLVKIVLFDFISNTINLVNTFNIMNKKSIKNNIVMVNIIFNTFNKNKKSIKFSTNCLLNYLHQAFFKII